MKLSIIVPGIRPENWKKLYDSVDLPQPWEIIFIGPVPNGHLPGIKNVKIIPSWRSPNACQQQGLLQATGDWITFAADDGIFLPGALDQAISMAEERTIVVGKYLEGEAPHPDMAKEAYYKFGYHKAYRIPGVPQDGLIFNAGIISRKFMLELGGWDAQHFDCTTTGHSDLGIRAHRAGAEMILMDDPLFKCSHMPGNTGDHAPINRAMKKDLKTFKLLHAMYPKRIVYLDNWKLTPEKWSERFGK